MRTVPWSPPHTGRTPAALTVSRGTEPVAPSVLAIAHPAHERDDARRLYERCLAAYRSARGTTDATHDDVRAAAARFVAANLRALRDVAPTADALARLEARLDGVLRVCPAWRDTDEAGRRLMFERLAILAVLIDTTAAQAPRQGADAVANVRRAAHGYLTEFLGLDVGPVVAAAA